jgi:hypothetical protein
MQRTASTTTTAYATVSTHTMPSWYSSSGSASSSSMLRHCFIAAVALASVAAAAAAITARYTALCATDTVTVAGHTGSCSCTEPLQCVSVCCVPAVQLLQQLAGPVRQLVHLQWCTNSATQQPQIRRRDAISSSVSEPTRTAQCAVQQGTCVALPARNGR